MLHERVGTTTQNRHARRGVTCPVRSASRRTMARTPAATPGPKPAYCRRYLQLHLFHPPRGYKHTFCIAESICHSGTGWNVHRWPRGYFMRHGTVSPWNSWHKCCTRRLQSRRGRRHISYLLLSNSALRASEEQQCGVFLFTYMRSRLPAPVFSLLIFMQSIGTPAVFLAGRPRHMQAPFVKLPCERWRR